MKRLKETMQGKEVAATALSPSDQDKSLTVTMGAVLGLKGELLYVHKNVRLELKDIYQRRNETERTSNVQRGICFIIIIRTWKHFSFVCFIHHSF